MNTVSTAASEAPASTTAATSADEILTLKDIQRRLKLARSTIYNHISKGQFPAPFKLCGKTVWLSSDIETFVAAQAANRGVSAPRHTPSAAH